MSNVNGTSLSLFILVTSSSSFRPYTMCIRFSSSTRTHRTACVVIIITTVGDDIPDREKPLELEVLDITDVEIVAAGFGG